MPPLVPRPLRSRTTPGSSPAAGAWSISPTARSLEPVARTAHDLIAPHCPGLSPHIDTGSPGTDGSRRIRLALAQPDELPPLPAPTGVDPSGPQGESERYRLTVDADAITCTARGPRGLLRAAATAAQLLGAGGGLEHQVIDDVPHYAWRGLMLDPARSFIALDDLRRLVDLAALHRLNVLHLHLTDNEAWRIEIPGRPRLTETAEGGYYSVEDFQGLQRYAADRYVTIVPEVDLPGHCAAATRAYPDLGVLTPPASVPPQVAAVLPRPLDPSDARSAAFIDEVYGALAALTHGPFVHIGGDEVFGISAEPFTAAVHRARAAVRAAGRRAIGWQETARAGSGPEDVSQFWVDSAMADLPVTRDQYDARPEFAEAGLTPELVRRLAAHFAPADQDVARALAGGGSVLLSPQSHLYLDRPYHSHDLPEAERERLRSLGFAHYRPQSVREAAAWQPLAHAVPEARIAGIEATLFGETLRAFEDLSRMLLPRLAGVAEIAWSGAPDSWPAYSRRLGAQARLWRQRDLRFVPAAGIDWA
ncbi:family 20 glycosylhydrolase [Actinospica durhamensis]|uniref:beta-N-acetylhexosaminidase n=1 Tax=Actinospica durhamensis TaxID=1508375 RepID=A0A941ITQ9_9ACTN|nr:family 20 glycosylhydrolase [Actinospica durhamensis]MBR7837942.1 family 20 glycosylhydrolase [Actinospica durhamensis]